MNKQGKRNGGVIILLILAGLGFYFFIYDGGIHNPFVKVDQDCQNFLKQTNSLISNITSLLSDAGYSNEISQANLKLSVSTINFQINGIEYKNVCKIHLKSDNAIRNILAFKENIPFETMNLDLKDGSIISYTCLSGNMFQNTSYIATCINN